MNKRYVSSTKARRGVIEPCVDDCLYNIYIYIYIYCDTKACMFGVTVHSLEKSSARNGSMLH